VAQYDGKPHLLIQYVIRPEWRRIEVAPELERLREGVLSIEARIAGQSPKQ